ncbi:hypothetical protein RvY_04916-3 [Ramazzottius varieornatus]|uniref:ABC transmembrane type-1 domain-containing protein n=1 Tax=Ramazzottius varieornatus TaxID=947166 RepID=A0A1D1UT81_RAMVA|nr:hypothetical protein RvY_04916-3 [Ramazzottius varieornatus]
MKILKLYAWEKSFEQQILDIREKEIEQLKKSAYLLTVSAFNWFITPFLVALSIFGTYVLISPENVLDADKAFVGLALLNILRQPLTMLPSAVTLLIQSRVSIGRLTKFLCNDELSAENVDNLPASREAPHSISIKDGSFAWAREEEPFLKNVNLNVKTGSLTAVVGQIGAGKSSLVASMLGLMEKKSGAVEIRGSLAYVPQQAWIQNMTVKNNILFGRPFDHERYEKVLDVCALRTDLELLSAGDETEIGERGANLSGGQRQRISLARAVYSDADVILLDDPLSAVDAHVGKHIFEQAIGPKGLLRGKTRILVTHGITYLPQTDLIVVLDKGKLSEVGSYLQLLCNNGAFAEFLRLYFLEEQDKDEEDIDPEVQSVKEDLLQRAGSNHSSKRPSTTAMRRSSVESKIREAFNRTLSHVSSTNKGKEAPKKSTSKVEAKVETAAGKLVEEETAEIGNVKLSVYDTYFKNSTYSVAGGMAFAYALYNAFNIWSSFWLTSWTEDAGIPERNGTEWRDYRLGIYGLFGILQGVTITVAYFLLAYGQIMASRNLHKGLLHRIMRAPMSFFDTTPLGRVVNRFSKDVEIVDTVIPMNIEGIVYCLLAVVATLMVVSISTPIFAPVIVPLAVFYFLIQRFYIPSSRQLKRLEAVSRSPIYSHFQESVSGSSVILAARQGDRFILENEQRVDANNMSFYLNIVSNRYDSVL